MNFGFTDRFILLGGGALLCQTAEYLTKKKISFLIVTSDRHFSEDVLSPEKIRLGEYLEKHSHPYLVVEDVNSNVEVQKLITSSTTALSFGAAWKFNENFIELFGGKLLNFHGSKLPRDRGGGGFSWRILNNDRIGINSVHQVTTDYDCGPVLAYEEYLFGGNCRLPIDYYEESVRRGKKFVFKIIESLKEQKEFTGVDQPEYLSSYWPRLSAEKHGYIDWQIRVEEIERFICAFDDPYGGASTFLNSNVVKIKKSYATLVDGVFHPFQFGLIYRTSKEFIMVAANGGTIIASEVSNEIGDSIISQVRVGDRLVTPRMYLDDALATRAKYGPRGEITKEK